MKNFKPILTAMSLCMALAAAAAPVRQHLHDDWQFRQARLNNWYPATVPGTVHTDLMANRIIEDPYFRLNERGVQWVDKEDWIYETHFEADAGLLARERIELVFEGLDTYADVYLNDEKVLAADNMFRRWRTEVKRLLRPGENTLKVYFHSPIKVDLPKYDSLPYRYEAVNDQSANGGLFDKRVSVFARKAGYHYGWDWGPRLPDAGLFREASVLAVKTARLAQVFVGQEHHVTGKTVHGNVVDFVRLTADAEIEWMPGVTDGKVKIVMTVTSPDGKTVLTAESGTMDPLTNSAPAKNLTGLTCDLRNNHVQASLTVENPELWWPNGYGAQALYQVKVELVADDILDTWEKKMGLRTITVNTDVMEDEVFDEHMTGQSPDYDDGDNMIMTNGEKKIIITDKPAKTVKGRNFAYEINGLQIFAMGADYIPEDNILTRQTRERTDLLLKSAQEANFNSLRVWGGGYFLDDFFYDVCDERGLLIWHDFMFACASYELTDDFEENISAEIRQNMRRLRSHASIALWCGNNEMETQYETLAWQKSKKQTYDYIHLYEYIIPKIVKEEDPEKFYWPSSPSSGGNYENSNAENVGDTHYWGVWHGSEPFTAYRSHHYRFLSEFGFQSFPALQTVKRFTEDGDRNIFSRVMEMHQRNTAANGKILNYISQTYLYPKNFDELLYCSQLLQADAIRYGVEHFRRFRGTCMGAVVWQLNDIWPVASWASVDYYGNWKALQYAEKKMFAPVLLSCEEHGEIDQKPFVNTLPHPIDVSADLHVANETGEPIVGTVKWSLCRPDSSVVKEGAFEVNAPAYGGQWMPHLDFNDQDPLEVHLTYELVVDGNVVSSGSTLFCAPKHYHFADPKLSVSVDGDTVTVTAENFAKSVSVETENGVLRLDDNFVDMEAGTKTFRILPTADFTAEGTGVSGAYRVRSVYETAER